MKQGWEEKMLKEIGVAQTGTTPKTAYKDNYGDFIPFIKPADIDIYNDGEIRYNNDGLSEKGLTNGRKMHNGSILMVCIGATIGKLGFVTRDVSCNQQVNSLTVKKGLDPKFVYYAMSTPSFFEQVIKNSAQATLPIINKGKWESLTITYPKSLPEQQRIVAIIDIAFAAIAKAKANAEQNLKNAKELFESYLQVVFETKGEGWEEKKLGEVSELINRGVSPKYLEENGVVVLNQKCIRDHKITFDKSRFHDGISKKVAPEKMVRLGDVLINSTGTGTLGRVAQVREDVKNVTVDSHVTIVRPIQDLFFLDFFGWALIFIEDEIAKRGEGCGGQTELARTALKNDFSICFPKSLKDQQTIVQKLHALSSETKKLEVIYQQKIKDLEELKKSVLQKAFAGELKTPEVCV